MDLNTQPINSLDRIFRTRMPAPIVRALDVAVMTSGGAYRDRDEFIVEAVRDRLLEEGISVDWHSVGPKSELQAPDNKSAGNPATAEGASRARRSPEKNPLKSGSALAVSWTWGQWRGRDAPRAERVSTPEPNWGLHNRDLGSLWALDLLAAMTADRGKPVAWKDFTTAARAKARLIGAELRQHDQLRNPLVKSAVGFPRVGPKLQASEERFVAGSLGSITGRLTGPLFILGLAGGSVNEKSVAPTKSGVELLAGLLDDGLDFAVPQPQAAALRWCGHLASCATEFELWMRVLRRVASSPKRMELTANFPEWTKSQGDTNTMGIVSRLREWGLLEAQLDKGRYRLTTLGREVLDGTS